MHIQFTTGPHTTYQGIIKNAKEHVQAFYTGEQDNRFWLKIDTITEHQTTEALRGERKKFVALCTAGKQSEETKRESKDHTRIRWTSEKPLDNLAKTLSQAAESISNLKIKLPPLTMPTLRTTQQQKNTTD